LTPWNSGESSQFAIDVDSVDFEKLDVMAPDKVLSLTHSLLDAVKIEGVPRIASGDAHDRAGD
jgi:hypothetical protein